MTTQTERTLDEKVRIFSSLFRGRDDVHGVLDPATGRGRMVKEPLTPAVIQSHLEGKRHVGIYVLLKDRVHFMAVDFDKDDPSLVQEFVAAAKHLGLPAYVERSKSKGFHVWFFFEEGGASAAKARLVARHLLEGIGEPQTEIFPKQDSLDEKIPYGNFIFAPLFGGLIEQQRTVFVEEAGSMTPFPDQWGFLESVQRIPESLLDEIIATNDLNKPLSQSATPAPPPPTRAADRKPVSFGLPICAQRMLNEGVRSNQRVACFRLAIQLRKAGLPYDITVNALMAWAQKNHPEDGKGILTEREIVDQTAWAYTKLYQGCGCEEAAVAWFCDPSCHLYKKRQDRGTGHVPPTKPQETHSAKAPSKPADAASQNAA